MNIILSDEAVVSTLNIHTKPLTLGYIKNNIIFKQISYEYK